MHGIGRALIEYVPGESTSGLFGGNSNWRGPIWMPTNYILVQAIERYHRFLGDDFKVPVPCLGGVELTLNEIAKLISDRLVEHLPPRRQAASRRCQRQPVPAMTRLAGSAAVQRVLPR